MRYTSTVINYGMIGREFWWMTPGYSTCTTGIAKVQQHSLVFMNMQVDDGSKIRYL